MSKLGPAVRHVVTTIAIVFVTLASISVGMTVAAAAPGSPIITTPIDQFETVSTTVTVSGTLPDATDQTVTVRVDDGGTLAVGCVVVVPYVDGSFTCDVVLPGPGQYALTATSVDATNDPSAASNTVTVRLGSTTPAAITSNPGYDNAWTTQVPTLSGTGPALGAVRVDITYNLFDDLGEQTVEYCTVASVPASGAWSCAGAATPAWGYVHFTAYGLDVLGNETVPGTSDDEIGGEMLPAPPAATYVLGPANFQVTLDGLPTWNVFADIIPVQVSEGGVYSYGITYEYCPLFSQNPMPGGQTETCFYGDLDPGIWNVYAMQEWEFFTGFYRDDYIMIPEQPGPLAATVNADRSVAFSGTGEPGYTVIVRDAGENQVCAGVVATGGGWQCTATPPAGTASYRAIQQATGFVATPSADYGTLSSIAGLSTYTPAVAVTVPPPPPAAPTPPGPVPAAPVALPATPLPWVLDGYDGSPLTPGQVLALSAQGLPAGTVVVVEIRSTPRVLGTAVADDTGLFALTVTVPADIEPGEHTLVAIATPPGGVESPVAIPVSVVAASDLSKASVESAAPEKVDAAGAGDGGPGGGAVDRSEPAAPSAMSDSIPTIDRIFRTPLLVVASGGLALALLFLVAFPAELLNSTLASNTRRLGRWYAAIDGGVTRATEWFAGVTRTRAAAAAVLVVLTSIIFGFVDPAYGFDPVSLRMTVSLAIGLFVVTYVASWISGAVIQRWWGIPTRVGLQPAALVFAVIGVVVARLLEFSPGFLIGLVIGLDLLTRVGAPHRVRAALTNIGVIVGLALLAWIGYSIMASFVSEEPTVVGALLGDALVATTSEGLTAALAALMPLGFLQGHEIFRRSKRLWAGSFAVVASLFALIVLPTASEDEGGVANVGFWMLVMAIFAAVTLTLWAILHFTNRADDEADDPSTHETSLHTAS